MFDPLALAALIIASRQTGGQRGPAGPAGAAGAAGSAGPAGPAGPSPTLAVVFVAPVSGSDLTGDGSFGKPWKSLQPALLSPIFPPVTDLASFELCRKVIALEPGTFPDPAEVFVPTGRWWLELPGCRLPHGLHFIVDNAFRHGSAKNACLVIDGGEVSTMNFSDDYAPAGFIIGDGLDAGVVIEQINGVACSTSVQWHNVTVSGPVFELGEWTGAPFEVNLDNVQLLGGTTSGKSWGMSVAPVGPAYEGQGGWTIKDCYIGKKAYAKFWYSLDRCTIADELFAHASPFGGSQIRNCQFVGAHRLWVTGNTAGTYVVDESSMASLEASGWLWFTGIVASLRRPSPLVWSFVTVGGAAAQWIPPGTLGDADTTRATLAEATGYLVSGNHHLSKVRVRAGTGSGVPGTYTSVTIQVNGSDVINVTLGAGETDKTETSVEVPCPDGAFVTCHVESGSFPPRDVSVAAWYT